MIRQPEVNQPTKTSNSSSALVWLRNILVATDFSQSSDRALEHALAVARTYNSKIVLAHVIPVDFMMAPELVDASREHMRRAAVKEWNEYGPRTASLLCRTRNSLRKERCGQASRR